MVGKGSGRGRASGGNVAWQRSGGGRGPYQRHEFDNRRLAGPGTASGRSHDFWRLWLEFKPGLNQLALRWMSGNRADAEDLLSKAAIKGHDRYLRDAPRIRNVRAWLARILHNLCMDEHRRHAVRGRALEELHPDQARSMGGVGRDPETPENRLVLEGAVDVAVGVILDMPKRLRHPFVLRFVYQYSNQEIARQLDLTEVNVRKRIQLGRAMVRSSVDPL